MKVLYVEDEEVDRMAFVRYFQKQDLLLDYRIAFSVYEALKELKSNQFDVVVSDFNLGDGTAFDLLEALDKTPAVVITSAGDEEIAVQAMKRGFYDYLAKDIDYSYLKALPLVLQRAIDEKTKAEELIQSRKELEQLAVELKQVNKQLQEEIDERILMEESLKESEKRFRQLFEKAPVAYQSLDEKGCFFDINPAFTDLLGYSYQDVKNRWFGDLLTPPYQNKFKERFQKFLKTGEVTRVELEVMKKDGDLMTVEVSGRVSQDYKEQFKKTHCVLHNVTDHIQLQENLKQAKRLAEEANRAKDHFLANMSHEIRTPMTGVLGMASLLMESLQKPEHKEMAKVIQSSGDNLLRIINDILDLSKIEAGKLELVSQHFDLVECVETSFDLFAFLATQKQIDLSYLIHPEVPFFVRGDMARLRQVLMNLIGNSLKFTDEGQIHLEVTSQSLENEDIELRFALSDTGIGIPKNKIKILFDAFSQAHASDTKRSSGTGLGLAICKRLLQLMDGDICIESEVGSGSTFYFTVRTRIEKIPLPEAYQTKDFFSGKNAMILSSCEYLNLGVEQLFKRWGIKSQSLPIDSKTLDRLENNRYDLVCLDEKQIEQADEEFVGGLKKWIDQTQTKCVSFHPIYRENPKEGLCTENVLRIGKPLKQRVLFYHLQAFWDHFAQNEHKTKIPQEQSGLLAEQIPLKILVAEDDPINKTVMEKILMSLGYPSDFVQNGKEVLEKLQSENYDLVFMDVRMPVMDGCQATQKIFEVIPDQERPKIVGVSANAMEEDIQRCMDCGMDDYLVKPVMPQVIKTIIQKINKAVTD